jgi:Copper transport outer membrane protein, MctB
LIDFRYHLVSIVAVFLALAIGVVLGSTALQPHVVNLLKKASTNEQTRNNQLHAQNAQLSQQLAADNAFAQVAARPLLHDLLAGERIVLVLAPGADGQTVSGVTTALQQAGATVSGQVILTSQFFDTSATTEQVLKSTAVNLAPQGIALPTTQADPQISGQQAAAQVIAAAIVNKDGLATMSAKQSQQILAGFGQQNFLQISGANGASLAGQATMAVVVIPNTIPSAQASGPFNLALVSMTQDLQESSKGAVLAGSIAGSGSGSAIDAVTSGGAGVALTTVDNADSESGQIVVAQALRELLNPGATPTSYGAGPGTVPSPAPSPIPSPSASPTKTIKKKT